ncbi:hypothetical protein EGW08_016470, partial [Elysia chlorotica]
AYWESSINSTWYRLEPTDFSKYREFLVIYFGYLNTIFKVLIPIACVSVCNTVLVCCLRRRRSLFAQHVQLCQYSDVQSPATQLSTAGPTANGSPCHSRENSRENSCEKRPDGCASDCSLKLSPIYRRGDTCNGHSNRDSCDSDFDLSASPCNKHSPGSIAAKFGSAREREQSSSFIRLGGKQYPGNKLSASPTSQHHHHHHHHHHQHQQQHKKKQHRKRTAGAGRSGDAKVTSMVLAVTWTFLISQAFAGAQVILHLTGSQATCGQRCVLFNQFCDLVYVLVSATNFL